MGLQTQFPFTLPKGYVDEDGRLHKRGAMRLATARDEIEPLRDVRVAENEAYLTVVMLARVVSEIGTIRPVTTGVIEGLFASDLAYLAELYGIVNFGDPTTMLPELEEAYRHPLASPTEPGQSSEDVATSTPPDLTPEPAMAGNGSGWTANRRPGGQADDA